MGSKDTGSRTMPECKKAINIYSMHATVRFIWVPNQQTVFGNKMANNLANKA